MKDRSYEKKMIMICIMIGIILIILAICNQSKVKEEGAIIEYTVKQGETLWSIACKLDLNENIQQTIYDIKEDNNNLDSIIYPGQVILLKVEVK